MCMLDDARPAVLMLLPYSSESFVKGKERKRPIRTHFDFQESSAQESKALFFVKKRGQIIYVVLESRSTSIMARVVSRLSSAAAGVRTQLLCRKLLHTVTQGNAGEIPKY
jgi:hypothetical protein